MKEQTVRRIAWVLSAIMLLSACFTLTGAAEPAEGASAVPVPENLVWDGAVARWDLVDDIEDPFYDRAYYVSTLYKLAEDDTPVMIGEYRFSYYNVICDYTGAIAKNGPGRYFFTVYVYFDSEHISDSVRSADKAFSLSDLSPVPFPAPSVNWKTKYDGTQKIEWTVRNGDFAEDALYFSRILLYRNGELIKTVDLDPNVNTYDFSASDIPVDADADFKAVVKLVPGPGETRYTESENSVEDTSFVLNPVKLLTRTVTAEPDSPVRAGEDTMVFRVAWTGGYGGADRIYVRLKITGKNGEVTERGGAYYWDLDYVQGSSRMSFSPAHLNYMFAEGDVVEWKLYISQSGYNELAAATGSFTVQASAPHTVTLDAQGLAANTTVSVEDRGSLYSMENVQQYYPVVPGYTCLGWSKERKPMSEYTYADMFYGSITEDITLYGVYLPTMNSVEVNVQPLVCGTKIVTSRDPEYRWYRIQDVSVKLSCPNGAPYAVDETDLTWMVYTDPPFPLYGSSEPYLKYFSGTVKGGETYYARFYIDMLKDENDKLPAVFGPSDDIVLTGSFSEMELKGVYSSVDGSYLYGTVGVKAVHDWGDISYTWSDDNGAVTAARTCRCAECGFTETETVQTVPSALGPGTQYTATFENPDFETQTKTVIGDVTFVLGDVDGENGVTAADARLALRAAVGLESYAQGTREFYAADVDLSGTLTAADARMILRRAVGFTDPEWGVKQDA